MRLPTTAYLPFGKTLRPPLCLQFQKTDCPGSQSWIAGRSTLQPVLNLSDFTFRAVIDWIKIRVTLQRVTQFQWIQKTIDGALPRKCRIVPVNPGAGNESDTFDITIQEPPSLAKVYEICNLILKGQPGRFEPTVQGIEISVDATPKTCSDEKRELLFGAMQRTIFTSRDITSSTRVGKPGDPLRLVVAPSF